VIATPSFNLSFLFLVFDAKGGEDCILACVLRVTVSLSVVKNLFGYLDVCVRLCIYFLSRVLN
jgi:hypothetical protein